MATKEKFKSELEILENCDDLNKIILFNDDFNTFDHVIKTLISTCEHTYTQAEQCSILVHYKGKCVVKTGSHKDLVPRCKKLLQAGLSAKIV
tara:strand:+ start:128 stop:403 length:276 start_codon:yes stop_codon:yes gene_type:complete